MGLGDGIGQKKPCHHLGPFFSNFLPQKILGYLKEFLRKKLKSAKKVTKLPALTVFAEFPAVSTKKCEKLGKEHFLQNYFKKCYISFICLYF
jgi:hypothetical protein